MSPARKELGRKCRRCGADDWYTNHAPRKFHARCAQCVLRKSKENAVANRPKRRQYEARWRKENRDRINATQREWYGRTMRPAEYRWQRRGIQFTADEYRQMLAEQGGVCAICKKECKSGKQLAVDHDHETMTVRGLLCNHCNMLAQDPGHLRAVLSYVSVHANGRRI